MIFRLRHPAQRSVKSKLDPLPRRVVCVLTAAIIFVTARSVLAQEPTGFRDAVDLLDAWTANRVASRGVPGLSIGVVVGDRLMWAQGYGYADLAKRLPATPQTLYGIRSITKAFTAVAVLQLRDAGKLQLDDALALHLGGVHVQKHSSRTPDITIRQLLTHTSGLQRDPPGTIWTDGIFSSEADLTRPLLQIYEPDTRWYYSNLGFALLGQIVAAEAKQPWHSYVQEHILRPLGMKSTRPVPQRNDPGLAIAYVRSAPGGELVPVDPVVSWPGVPTALDGAGSIASDVEDLAKYVAFQMDEGGEADSPVLSGRTLREMHRPQWLLDDWQRAWGLGVSVRRSGGHVEIGHEGGGGYASGMYFIPALKLGIIVLMNSEDDDPAEYIDYATQLLAPIVGNTPPHSNEGLSANDKLCVGLYEAKKHMGRMFVGILDGNLVMVAPDDPNPHTGSTILQRTSEPHVFYMREAAVGLSPSPGEKLTFDTSADGVVIGFHTHNMRFARIGPLAAPRDVSGMSVDEGKFIARHRNLSHPRTKNHL